eukprot:6212343-Pleurochrysis_carterae.AAC.3
MEASLEVAGSSAHGDGEGLPGVVRSGLSVRDPDGGGSTELSGEIRAEFNAILPARALAIIMFRSGGYAACEAELHPCSPRVPPTSDACVRWAQEREESLASAGCRPGVHRNVVYFCARAPKAQRGNVM